MRQMHMKKLVLMGWLTEYSELKLSSQNSSNRQQQRTKHVMGSKNFSQCSFELRNQETGEEPSDLLWRTTHTKHGAWSNPVSASVYSTLQNNASTQVAPIIEEEDETGGHENENEDGLQEVDKVSVGGS
ncbi:uncharacterized protein [Miscanthus floridulus]|uniref:uncharacterized protein isoform X1 n=2 Tax=Miscanthus floridulus TaxID=154761 RepID=UPI0034576A2F